MTPRTRPYRDTLHALGWQDRVLLAPMSGVTDRPFRDYIRNLGQGQVVTEMIASEAAIRQVKDSSKLNQAIDDEPGIIVQLAGTEPDLIAEAARIMEGRGAHTIDLNFGCPARKVVTKASGSALMRHESLCADIFETVRAAISVPLTVKMRLGWDDQSFNAPKLARKWLKNRDLTELRFTGGPGANSTRAKRTGPKLATYAAPRLYRCWSMAIFAALTTRTRPWPLRCGGRDDWPRSTGSALAAGSGRRSLAGRHPRPTPGATEREAGLFDLLDRMLAYHGTAHGLRQARKHVSSALVGIDGAGAFRKAANTTDDPLCHVRGHKGLLRSGSSVLSRQPSSQIWL